MVKLPLKLEEVPGWSCGLCKQADAIRGSAGKTSSHKGSVLLSELVCGLQLFLVNVLSPWHVGFCEHAPWVGGVGEEDLEEGHP